MRELKEKILKYVTFEHPGTGIDRVLWLQVSHDLGQLGHILTCLHTPLRDQHQPRERNTIQDLEDRIKEIK